jgi:benzylsuccinate CoA-transferase BbsF subunit
MKGIFEGIKVVDFGWVIVAPMIAEYLAYYGAEVIHIETFKHPDLCRITAPFKDNVKSPDFAATFTLYNTNKYGILLDLSKPESITITEKLIAWGDILIESFTPQVKERWGLDYNTVIKANPSIIMLSTSAQGQTGPRFSQSGTGIQLASIAGFADLCGWPDRSPAAPFGAITDFITSRLGLAALIAALIYRRKTGKGQFIDLSQYEAGVYFLAPASVEYCRSGYVATRMGNRCPHAAPHGAYPCQGEDKWCVIAVTNDFEWEGFCGVRDSPDWAQDPKFLTLRGRKANEDELDKLIAGWTFQFTAQEIMERLQEAGVPAGIVQTPEDIYFDPQLQFRHHFCELEHQEIGKYFCKSPGFRLSKTLAQFRAPAPCLGQHSEYVCTQILGMSTEEFVQYLEKGVFE